MPHKTAKRRASVPCPLPLPPLTIAEAAAVARVDRRTVHRWVAAGFFQTSRPIAAGSAKRLVDRRSFFEFVGLPLEAAA
ncbi:MAG: helix-turn-helix domain-containing protein [Planctomycetota bacterium]